MDDFRLELIEEASSKMRCKHLRVDENGPYCSKDLAGDISQSRRLVCDRYSLQFYCLSRYEKCIWYSGEVGFD